MKYYSSEKYRQVCIKYNFFSCGTNSQYEKVFTLINNGISLNELAIATYICSCNYSLETIKSILVKEM